MPSLVGESKSIAGWAKELHASGGTVGRFLIGLHAAAALFHHHVVRDNACRLCRRPRAIKPLCVLPGVKREALD